MPIKNNTILNKIKRDKREIREREIERERER
jgi:hypothetical protein